MYINPQNLAHLDSLYLQRGIGPPFNIILQDGKVYWWGKRLVPVADKDAHLKDPEQLLLGTPYSQPTLCNLVHGCEILFHNPNLDCQKLQALYAIKGVTFMAYGHNSCFYELCVINSCFKRTTNIPPR